MTVVMALTPEMEELPMYRCECCGKMSEGDGHFGDICGHCNWEIGVSEHLAHAQKNVKAHGRIWDVCTSCGMYEPACDCGWCMDCNTVGPHLCTMVYPNFHCSRCNEGIGDSNWYECQCIVPKWAPGPIPADKKKTKRDTRLKCPPLLRIVSG